MPTLRVTQYAPRPRHGGSHAHSTVATDLDTGARCTYRSRGFRCLCGEPLHDGDPVLADSPWHAPVHVNCAALA
jgi:hypothetical protein